MLETLELLRKTDLEVPCKDAAIKEEKEEEEPNTFQKLEDQDFEFDFGLGFDKFIKSESSFVENSDDNQSEEANILDFAQNILGLSDNNVWPLPKKSIFSFEDSSTQFAEKLNIDLKFSLTDCSMKNKSGRKKSNMAPSDEENQSLIEQVPSTPVIQKIKYEKQGVETWKKAKASINIDVNQIENYYNNQGECLLCGNKYISAYVARRHIKTLHLKLREYVCPKCPSENFPAHTGLKGHLKKFHPEVEIIDLRLTRTNGEIQPGKIYHLDGESLNDKANFVRAKSCVKIDEIIVLECHLCGEKSRTSKQLKHHMIIAHPGKKERVVKKSYNGVEIKQEPEVHNTDSNSTESREESADSQDLSDSPQASVSSPTAKKHKGMEGELTKQQNIRGRYNTAISHSGPILPNPITCNKCPKVLTKVKDFNVHMKEHWKVDNSCAMCNIPKQSQCGLLAHVRRHSGQAPYRCTGCPKIYKAKGELRAHERNTCHDLFAKYASKDESDEDNIEGLSDCEGPSSDKNLESESDEFRPAEQFQEILELLSRF